MDELFANIRKAHEKIRPQVDITPLTHSPALSAALGCEVMLKLDHLQPTGSFKIRGATNKVRLLNEEARHAGVLTASTGNHGLAVARAGALAGVPVTVYVGSGAVQSKMDGIRALGAELVVVEGPPFAAESAARRRAEAEGRVYISPYNDLQIVAGQGTVGIEMMEQDPELEAVFIATGAGGLTGGTGTAIKAMNPRVEIVGVWPTASACLLRALEAGEIIPVEEYPTLSDATTGAIEPGSVTFPICQRVIDTRIEVSETEIASAMRSIAETERWIIEGAAGVALAGLVQRANEYRGRKVAILLCGRNIGLETFLEAVATAPQRR